mgnify:CR=1 FL=1|tara:strand:- start:2185 stop:2352 length:168 start_codon:yes stop_codon:yes gene_type:complete
MPEKRTTLSIKESTKKTLDEYLDFFEEKTGLRVTNISFLEQSVLEKIERDKEKLK